MRRSTQWLHGGAACRRAGEASSSTTAAGGCIGTGDRSLRRPSGEIVERVDFVPVTKTTQALYELEQDDIEEEEEG